MVASDRMLRILCWSLIVFVIASALLTLTLSINPFATPVADNVDFVERLLVYRGDDVNVYPLVLIGALATIGVYMVAALLGPVLRRFAQAGAAGDVMAVIFVVGGIVGITGQLLHIAVSQAATNGYCDCGYKTYELIAQAYALDLGWIGQNWLGVGAVTIVGVGAALAGRVVNLSRDFKIISYLIAFFLLVAVALRLLEVYQLSDQLVGLTSGIGVPIWAFLLARGSRSLAASSQA